MRATLLPVALWVWAVGFACSSLHGGSPSGRRARERPSTVVDEGEPRSRPLLDSGAASPKTGADPECDRIARDFASRFREDEGRCTSNDECTMVSGVADYFPCGVVTSKRVAKRVGPLAESYRRRGCFLPRCARIDWRPTCEKGRCVQGNADDDLAQESARSQHPSEAQRCEMQCRTASDRCDDACGTDRGCLRKCGCALVSCRDGCEAGEPANFSCR